MFAQPVLLPKRATVTRSTRYRWARHRQVLAGVSVKASEAQADDERHATSRADVTAHATMRGVVRRYLVAYTSPNAPDLRDPGR